MQNRLDATKRSERIQELEHKLQTAEKERVKQKNLEEQREIEKQEESNGRKDLENAIQRKDAEVKVKLYTRTLFVIFKNSIENTKL